MVTNGCAYEGCSSKHSDWIYHSILVAAYPATHQYITESYGENAQQSSCGGCSMEPKVKPGNEGVLGVAGAASLANDAVAGIGNGIVSGLPPNVFIDLNYYEDPNRNLFIDSLQITNGGGQGISLQSFKITASGSPYCGTSACVYGTGGNYSIQPGSNIHSSNELSGIGVVAQGGEQQLSISHPPILPMKITNFHIMKMLLSLVLSLRLMMVDIIRLSVTALYQE